MRIIAGEFRGRKLLPPEGDVTRPITDRVKQSVFDILTPLLEGATIEDCFCGTGSMGLESLSRGAAHATFFEADRSALARLRKNIELLQVGERCARRGGGYFRLGGAAATERADIIFLDPPYRFLREKSGELQALAGQMGQRLSAEGTLVFRHDAADILELPGLRRYDLREYGGMAVEFLHPANTPAV